MFNFDHDIQQYDSIGLCVNARHVSVGILCVQCNCNCSFHFTFQRHMVPIIFYINSIFSLHGILVCALYTVAWLLSGSWMGGALAALFYIFNR